MTTPKSVKVASVISFSTLAVWLLATIIINFFQNSFVSVYAGSQVAEKTDYILSGSTIVYTVSALIIAACDFLMIKNKTTLAPLIISGLTAVLAFPLANIAMTVQTMLFAHLQGANTIARISAITRVTGYTSYILNAALVCTVAASAVYAYAKKKGVNNENPQNT